PELSSLYCKSRPSGERAKQSVNVPPTSIQNSHRLRLPVSVILVTCIDEAVAFDRDFWPSKALYICIITPQIGIKAFSIFGTKILSAERNGQKLGSNPFATRSREPYIDCYCPLRKVAWTKNAMAPASVSHWINPLKAGDARAAQQLWERYYPQLVN